MQKCLSRGSKAIKPQPWYRCFSTSVPRREIRDISELPVRIQPNFQETRNTDLLCLQWPSPLRNVMLVKKSKDAAAHNNLLEFAQHITSTYDSTKLILEPSTAEEYHSLLPFPVYTETTAAKSSTARFQDKVDLVSTLGGDGTILRAASLFATARNMPPVLSFSMGTLGFLGEWRFDEYKRAFREVYMSGASDAYGSRDGNGNSTGDATNQLTSTGWSSIRGKSMGSHRGARVLLRNRLQVGVFNADGTRIPTDPTSSSSSASASASSLSASSNTSTNSDVYAMNEVVLHRGISPHLAQIQIHVGGRLLTEAVADGLAISTPTGSTAYSLSSGGSIVHPLVPSILLTPICPRSLSFRPLILPANTPISLRLSERNRGRELEVSVDGVRMQKGLTMGKEVRAIGEGILRGGGVGEEREWRGGVPSVVRGTVGMEGLGEDHWVGGLNALLKFNYPFGQGE